MIEGRQQLDLRREQHAIAEDIAGHVAHTGNAERCRLDIDIDFTKMPLDRFPGAPRRDAHLLVVVAHGTTRGESIAQPMTMRFGDAIGYIGEGRRALVGSDNEIGIIAIMADGVGGRHQTLPLEIIRQGQQGSDEEFVGLRPLCQPGRAIRGRRQLLGDEAALGSNRHDDGILDLLGLDQAQHFGAKILRAIRPADTTTRHFAEAQMHAFDTRRMQEDFKQWLGQGQAIDLGGIEFEGDDGAGTAIVADLVEIAAHRRLDQVAQQADDAVFIEALDICQALADLLEQRLLLVRAGLVGQGRIKPRLEQAYQRLGDIGVFAQGFGDVILSERGPHLLGIAR